MVLAIPERPPEEGMISVFLGQSGVESGFGPGGEWLGGSGFLLEIFAMLLFLYCSCFFQWLDLFAQLVMTPSLQRLLS